jgi:hypothetical protein|tara:strand:+ start:74 stop:754 length:681 start_codon:yes stop_codon:yes gene_type:complete
MKLIDTQIAFGGFYQGQHNANIENLTDYYFDDVSYIEDDNFVDYFNWSSIRKNYIKFWVDKFEDYLKNNYNIKTQNEHIDLLDGEGYQIRKIAAIFEDINLWSPKYYNYTTDHIDCKIYKRYAAKLHKALRYNEDFKKYVKQGTTSYDGYMSHFTYNEIFENKDDFLTVYCLDFLANKFNEDKFYELAEDVYSIDIDLTEAGKKKLNKIQVEVNRPANPNQLSFNF